MLPDTTSPPDPPTDKGKGKKSVRKKAKRRSPRAGGPPPADPKSDPKPPSTPPPGKPDEAESSPKPEGAPPALQPAQVRKRRTFFANFFDGVYDGTATSVDKLHRANLTGRRYLKTGFDGMHHRAKSFRDRVVNSAIALFVTDGVEDAVNKSADTAVTIGNWTVHVLVGLGVVIVGCGMRIVLVCADAGVWILSYLIAGVLELAETVSELVVGIRNKLSTQGRQYRESSDVGEYTFAPAA